MPAGYAMKPIVCNSCKAKFEPNIISRIALWLFMTALFSLVFVQPNLISNLGENASFIVLFLFLGLFFLLALIGGIVELFRPWQFTLWDERVVRRSIVNFGSLASFLLYAAIFYSQRGM